MKKHPRIKTMLKLKNKSLYIHIPFCEHICSYCDFTKLFYNDKFSKLYLEALFNELDSYKIGKMETIYIGGGTPTALNDEEFEKLLCKASSYLDKNTEFTCEANVENLSSAKLTLMDKYGVTRLSIGVQSSHDERLKTLMRCHSFNDAVKVVNEAKKHNFSSINVDLIYGYPSQSKEELLEDLENILKLDTDHISIYSLSVSPGSIFYNNKVKEQNQDDSRDYYDLILSTLRKHGYERYEISNFARNKKYSRHNLTYWHDEPYYGVGLGASGYVNGVRYTNTKSLDKYLKGEYVAEKEEVTPELDLEYYLLTNLRLEKGFSRQDFIDRFDFDFVAKYKDEVLSLEKKSQIIVSDDRIMLSDEGLMIMDSILLKLI